MNSNNRIVLICLSLFLYSMMFAQELKVTLDPNNTLVDRDKPSTISTIVFDSKVKGLSVSVTGAYELFKPSENFFVYRIDTKAEIDAIEFCRRKFTIQSPKSAVHREVLDIMPNTMYYYTVVLPDQYSKNLSVEYLFTKSAMHGVRLSYGKRIGFYVSYKWGEYLKAGSDIADVVKDYDVTKAQELGYIRSSITGGLRFGVLHAPTASLYVLMGGGYGEYGRQWQNPMEIDKNIYFHSDYIKGFDGEVACQAVLWDWLCLSAGADMLVGNGNISIDYQLGLGVNLNIDKLFKKKVKE